MEALTKWRLSLEDKSLRAAGELLGVSAAQMHRYESGSRAIPAEKAIAFETITGISRSELRPDIYPPAMAQAS